MGTISLNSRWNSDAESSALGPTKDDAVRYNHLGVYLQVQILPGHLVNWCGTTAREAFTHLTTVELPHDVLLFYEQYPETAVFDVGVRRQLCLNCDYFNSFAAEDDKETDVDDPTKSLSHQVIILSLFLSLQTTL